MSVQELSAALKQSLDSEDLFKVFKGTTNKARIPEYTTNPSEDAEIETNRQDLEKCFVPLVNELKLQQNPQDPKRRDRINKSVKNRLRFYKFGDRLGKESFRGLDVSDMNIVRIAVIGPTGSGKSCFIGTCERALFGEKRQTCFGQGAGSEGTVLLDEYLGRHTFQLIDTRGFFDVNSSTVQECLDILSGRIQAGQEIYRNDDQVTGTNASGHIEREMTLARRVHAVIMVVKANDPRLQDGSYSETMKTIRECLKKEGYAPVTVITCEDSISSPEIREKVLSEACAATGSEREETFFITNYTHDHKEFSLTTEQQTLDILYSVLKTSEQFVKNQKLGRKKRTNHNSAPSRPADHSLKQFFSQLQEQHDWDLGRVSCIVADLAEQEIHTVAALKECWEELKSKLGMTFVMRKIVEMSLQ